MKMLTYFFILNQIGYKCQNFITQRFYIFRAIKINSEHVFVSLGTRQYIKEKL